MGTITIKDEDKIILTKSYNDLQKAITDKKDVVIAKDKFWNEFYKKYPMPTGKNIATYNAEKMVVEFK